jgi:hypothetical protein
LLSINENEFSMSLEHDILVEQNVKAEVDGITKTGISKKTSRLS